MTTPTLSYFSASQIQRFRRCPRSWYNAYVLGQREPETEAQRIGKVIHAQMEAVWLDGTEPTHPLAVALRDGLPFLPSTVDRFAVEQDTESGVFQLAGLPMRGFVDLQVWRDGELTILDYKTTSSWRWAKTEDALRVDPQLNLYAAWAFYTYPKLPRVTVGHLAVNKQDTTTRWTAVTRTREEVRSYCTGIVETLQAMIAVAGQPVQVVPQNEAACGDYGGCSYRDGCWAAQPPRWALNAPTAPVAAPAPTTSTPAPSSRLDALRARREARRLAPAAAAQPIPEAPAPVPAAACSFIPPDADHDREPEPLDTRPIADVLPKGALDGAAARGLHTVADLLSFLAVGGELRDIQGVGPKAVDKIAAELNTISGLWPSARLRLRRALDRYAVDPDAEAALLARVRALRGLL